MRERLKALLRDRPEDSAALRLLALAVTWWAGAALGAVGAPLWVWAGGPLIATAGHAISWLTRHRGLPLLRWAVVLAVLALSGQMALQLHSAWDGNWLPAARSLVFVQAIASFDLRTRGGLHTTFFLSATILFLASQLAFGQEFLVFLAGYFVLLLTFMATSTVRDAVQHTLARGTWPVPAKLSSWLGWGGAVLAIGVGLFLLLPWGTLRSSAGADATAAILPVTGGTDAALGPSPGGGADGAEQETDQVEVTVGDSETGGTDAEQGTDQVEVTVGDQDIAATGESPAVLRVRSPVASYWRGQTYSRFDGQQWRPDAGVAVEQRISRSLAGRYTQTYYVVEEQPQPLLAYTPLDWGLVSGSREGDGLEEKTVYRGVSQRLRFEAEALRAAARARRPRLSRDPSIPVAVRELAQEIVGDASNIFDRALLITQYLRDNYRYEPGPAPSPDAVPSIPKRDGSGPTSPEAFLFDGDGAGGSADFASAHALLARAAGLDSRVATGFLPGGFDPLSGAYIVRRGDAHAWAEVRFPGFGWVPFDPSPRQDLPVRAEQAGLSSRIVNEVFQWQAGDAIGDSIGAGFDVLTDNLLLTASVLVGIGSVVLIVWSLALRRRRSPRRSDLRYTGLDGRERREIVAANKRLEATQGAWRIPPRRPAETLAAYFARAVRLAPHLEDDLAPVRAAVDGAAYSPTCPTREDVARVRDHVGRIRPALRRNPPLT